MKAEIRKLCKEKDAIILAHYYTVGAIQDIADFVGDSLALARKEMCIRDSISPELVTEKIDSVLNKR